MIRAVLILPIVVFSQELENEGNAYQSGDYIRRGLGNLDAGDTDDGNQDQQHGDGDGTGAHQR